MLRRMVIAASAVALLSGVGASPAIGTQNSTLTLKAVGCSDCIVYFGSMQAGINKQVRLHKGTGSIRLPVDAGWYGLSVQTKKGMSGAGAATLVVMNYAGYIGGDRVSNKQSRRAPLGTSCAYFFRDETVRFIVKRDNLPKRYWDDPTTGGFRKYLRAWASPQEDQTVTEEYRPTNKGQLATQNANCNLVP